jgi:hypothetical protein
MAARIIIGIVALVGVPGCGIMSALVNNQIVDAVNDKLAEGERFEAFGWYFAKWQRLPRAYEGLYPDGTLVFQFRVLVTLAILCLVTGAWSIGFFGP